MTQANQAIRQQIRVFLVDDHEIVRRGIAGLIATAPDLTVVGEAGTAVDAVARVRAVRPHVAVLDGRLPDGTGVEICREIRAINPEIRCLILTSYDDADAVLSAILGGAAGYVLKNVRGPALIDAIRQVAAGQSLLDPSVTGSVLNRLRAVGTADAVDPRVAGLTERERRLLDLLTDGLSNREISQQLFITEKTAKNYVSILLGKLGLERRAQAAVLGAQLRSEGAAS